MTLDPTQTAALVSPNRKGGEFFTGDGNEEMLQDTLTGTMAETDLTNGVVSNGGNGLTDGLKPTELPEKDVRNGSKSGTKDGPMDLTDSAIKSGTNRV